MSPAYSASEWTDVFVATAGASAALAGLLFVALSINAERILGLPGLPERALEALTILLGVVVVSVLALAPGVGRTTLGALLLATAGVVTGAVAALAARGLPHRQRPPGVIAGQLFLSASGSVPLVVGGVSLLAGSGGGLYWVARRRDRRARRHRPQRVGAADRDPALSAPGPYRYPVASAGRPGSCTSTM